MRRTLTGLLSIGVICVAGVVMSQNTPPQRSTPRSSTTTPTITLPLLRSTGDSVFVDRMDFPSAGQPGVEFREANSNAFDPFAGPIQHRGVLSVGDVLIALASEELAIQQRMNATATNLTSDDEEVRTKAQAELEQAVVELFDYRSKTRLKQIEDLEARLQKLRSQMEQREEKKSEIVHIHVQALVNKANGLDL